jgi:hypothetical protein
LGEKNNQAMKLYENIASVAVSRIPARGSVISGKNNL